MLLATINSGTLIIALPDLERSLHTSLLELVWVILVYMIASTVLVLSAGRLSDQFGRKKAYIGGFIIFAFASLGAGFAANGTQLILWRILQGIGGSFLFANAAAIVTDAFPREQLGLAMGTNTMIAAVGLVIGPVLGGALVLISWHWVFWFNVPFGLLGSLWAFLVLRELTGRSEDRSFDYLGTITFLVGLTGLVLGISKGGISGWDSPVVIGGLTAAAVLLPAFVVIEGHVRSPMLDLSIFKSRLFSAAAAAAFINGLSRFALMFVFVFYFQGVQGNSPVLAGVKLAPLALGMLIASPLAGIWADRRGSRGMAVAGMLVSAAGLALMTTLERNTSYLPARDLHARRRRRLGHVQLPQLGRDDGRGGAAPPRDRRRRPRARDEHGRGDLDRIRVGDRHLLGAQDGPVRSLLGPCRPHLHHAADTLHRQHAHSSVVSVRRLPARRVRGRRAALGARGENHVGRGGGLVSATAAPTFRIGEVAELTGTTPRTIRYYEEIGLLPGAAGRAQGKHRCYSEGDVDRVREILRLKELLGLTLEQLSKLLDAEASRAELRREWASTDDPAEQTRILHQAQGHISDQLELVRGRRRELEALEKELLQKRREVQRRLTELDSCRGPAVEAQDRPA